MMFKNGIYQKIDTEQLLDDKKKSVEIIYMKEDMNGGHVEIYK